MGQFDDKVVEGCLWGSGLTAHGGLPLRGRPHRQMEFGKQTPNDAVGRSGFADAAEPVDGITQGLPGSRSRAIRSVFTSGCAEELDRSGVAEVVIFVFCCA
ncbi:MAG: hypothetical protein IPK53_10530 [bacterium]|nr:hypothetical protein [bacterium]